MTSIERSRRAGRTHEGARRGVSLERKGVYYCGLVMLVVGLLLFFSTFFAAFAGNGLAPHDMGSRAIAGMALMFVGGLLRGIGARGLAGSGVTLDPEQARKDLEPHSRLVGGLVGDALDEAGIDLGRGAPVVIRCRACRKLNEEDSKFCQECGKEL